MKKLILFVSLIALSFGAYAIDGVNKGYGTAKWVNTQYPSARNIIKNLLRPAVCSRAIKCSKAVFDPDRGQYLQAFPLYVGGDYDKEQAFCAKMGGQVWGAHSKMLLENLGYPLLKSVIKYGKEDYTDFDSLPTASLGQLAYKNGYKVQSDHYAPVITSADGVNWQYIPGWTANLFFDNGGYIGWVRLHSVVHSVNEPASVQSPSYTWQSNTVICKWDKELYNSNANGGQWWAY